MSKQKLQNQLASIFGVHPDELTGQNVADMLVEAESFGVEIWWDMIPSEISTSKF